MKKPNYNIMEYIKSEFVENGYHRRYAFLKEGGSMKLLLNDEDEHRVDKRGHWSDVVTDQATGKTFKVRGASCGLPHCMCAIAIVKEIV
jgi:hypothetical protein